MTRRKFSREFKIEAVRLVTDCGAAVTQAASDLDVAESVLRRWMRATSPPISPQRTIGCAIPTSSADHPLLNRRSCANLSGRSRCNSLLHTIELDKYSSLPLANLESYRPLIRILFQQIYDVLMRTLPKADEWHQVLLMLDEFFALGRMTSLASKIAVSAGYGFRMAIILQNLSQLDELYGKSMRETLVAGCAIKLFVAINDNAKAEHVSESLGNYTTDTRTQIVGTGLTQSARVSVTKIGIPLKRPDALMRMPRKTSLLLVANARPMEVGKTF